MYVTAVISNALNTLHINSLLVWISWVVDIRRPSEASCAYSRCRPLWRSFERSSCRVLLIIYKYILRVIHSQCLPITHQHCSPQELLEDLRQKYSVVRDQCSWEDDTNPFCCDRCWESSPLPGSPEMEPVAAPSVVDALGEIHPGQHVSEDVASGTRYPPHPALEEAKTGPKSELDAGASRLGGSEGGGVGAAPEPSLDAVERGDRSPPPAVLSATSVEEDTDAVGSTRGAVVRSEVRDDGACPELRPPQKKASIAAAFSAHLRGVDKYPLELARLCRFAQFLTENELLREAYEVSLG